MTQFAKLFDTAAGQVLVLKEHDGESPALKHFISPEGMGLCCMAAIFTQDDEGLKARDEAFEKEVNQEYADGFAAQFVQSVAQVAPDEQPGEFELPMHGEVQ